MESKMVMMLKVDRLLSIHLRGNTHDYVLKLTFLRESTHPESYWNLKGLLVSISHQYVHLRVARRNKQPWLLIVVYGSPNYACRQQLRAHLMDIVDDV
ncbi:hypothetical protein CR513_11646, partial [Mucuna pruriens]